MISPLTSRPKTCAVRAALNSPYRMLIAQTCISALPISPKSTFAATSRMKARKSAGIRNTALTQRRWHHTSWALRNRQNATEYTKLGFLPRDGIFAAVFFTLTGFHGAHVTGGVVFNSICFFRTLKGQFTARRHLAIEAASIYWHFVDVVWIGLFITIYIIG